MTNDFYKLHSVTTSLHQEQTKIVVCNYGPFPATNILGPNDMNSEQER